MENVNSDIHQTDRRKGGGNRDVIFCTRKFT